MVISQPIDRNIGFPDISEPMQWGLDLTEITKAQQHGDCLYLHCRADSQTENQVQGIIATIASQQTSNSPMLAAGIRRVKLHGKMWALAVDLPIGAAAKIAAEITANLVQEFAKKQRTSKTVAKIILKQNCLNILCESLRDIPQVEMALPILAALRKTNPSDALKAVSVTGRLKGGPLPDWAFQIDLLTLGIDRGLSSGKKHTPIQTPELKTEPVEVLAPAQLIAPQVEDRIDRAIDLEIADRDINAQTVDVSIDLDRDLESAIVSEPLVVVPIVQPEIAVRSGVKSGVKPKTVQPQIDRVRSKPQPKKHFVISPASLKPLYSWLFTTDGTKQSANNLTVNFLSLLVGLAIVGLVDRIVPKYVPTLSTASMSIPSASIDPKHKLIVTRQIPNYKNVLLGQKLDLLNWHLSVFRQPPDVMIVGSSRALRGIDPTILEESLAQRGYKGVQVFNMGINGATAKTVNLQIAQILDSGELPKMIIWADGVRAFNSNRQDLTFKEIASSPGFAEINAQIASQSDPNSTKESTNNSGLGTHPTGNQLSERPAEKFLENILLLPLATYANRDQLRSTMLDRYNQFSKNFSNSSAIIAASLPKGKMEMDSKGFLALSVIFDPKTYFQVHPFVSGENDSDYHDFDLSGEQMDAFNSLSNFCQQRKIRLVFVNMPLHSTYLDPTRTKYDAIFSARMLELASAWDFYYIDLSQAWRDRSDNFSDPSHLNRYGAVAVAQELATNPVIPWKELR